MKLSDITPTDQDVEDIIDTACYGGITYWATILDDGPTVDGDAATWIREDETGDVFSLHPDVIRRGFARYPEHLVNKTTLVGSLHIYEEDCEVTDLDVDAGAADLIVQFGLFGEERYA